MLNLACYDPAAAVVGKLSAARQQARRPFAASPRKYRVQGIL
jgi:hypothetical protein